MHLFPSLQTGGDPAFLSLSRHKTGERRWEYMGILAEQLLAVWTLLSTSSEFSRILLDSEWTHPYPSQQRLHVDRADDLQHKDTFSVFLGPWTEDTQVIQLLFKSIYAAYDHIWSYMIIYVPGFLLNPIHENPIFSVHSKHFCCIQLIPGSWRAFREAKKDTAAQTASTKPTSAAMVTKRWTIGKAEKSCGPTLW